METPTHKEWRARQSLNGTAVWQTALSVGGIFFIMSGGGPWTTAGTMNAAMGRLAPPASRPWRGDSETESFPAGKLAKLPASVFRRNLIVSGVSLSEWKNRRFRLQGVEFEGTQECTPCEWMDRVIASGASEFLKEHFRGGLRAKVVHSGTLRLSLPSP